MSVPSTFATQAIHAGQEPDPATGAVAPPTYQTSTFVQDSVGDMRAGYEYSRSANPTRSALETCLATLESGQTGHAYASGLAAESALLRTICGPGDHVVIPADAYDGTFRLVEQVLRGWGLESTAVPFTDPVMVSEAIRPTTRLVLCETPTNPTLEVVDLATVSAITHEAGVLLAVDNTLASPYLQQPLAFGADVVVHSTSKYLSGHSDVVGGALITNDTDLGNRLRFGRAAEGAIAGPFDCWLTLRGIKSLPVRMQQHCDNAKRVATMLADHPSVAEIFYPGLAQQADHELISKQMTHFDGMVSFRVIGGAHAAQALCAATTLFSLGVSLGGVESVIGYPAAMTHTSTAGTDLAVPADPVRLSVGIESADDLLTDLRQALTTL